MKPLIILAMLLLATGLHSQVIPAERQVNWSDALLSCEYDVPLTEVNVMDFGAMADGTTNDQPAVISAMASLNGNPGYVYFPPGNYRMTAPISLPDGVVLKGYSSDQSVMLFHLGGASQNCITMAGTYNTPFIHLDQGYIKGSDRIVTDSAFLFTAGDYAEIVEDNGSWDDHPATWAIQSVGQIVQVDSVDADTIFLANPLRITYEAALYPRIRKITPRLHAGVECLKIKRLDQSTSGANIMMALAAYCRVRGVESDVSVSAHIDIFQSTRILIEGNYFHHAFEYNGTSKHGYGVTLNAHTGECLVINNIFRYLRHAMMVKTGANGNVFAFNYSREVHRSEIFSTYGGDISLHGHYPYANLFEGNIVQNIIIDHANGPSGPHNTFFRNRAENYGIIITAGAPNTSDSQHIVGNDVTYNGLWYVGGPYSITGTGHIQHGNNIDGVITPSGTNTLSDTSYYHDDEPAFWDIADPWPSLGIPNTLGTGGNPARSRWFAGGPLTVCPLRKTWTGAVSSNWTDPHNWAPYGTPGQEVEVTIPQPAGNGPQISDGLDYQIRSLFIDPDGEIQILDGSLNILK